MSDVYITGIDMIAFGRYPHRTPASLGAQAALGALDDAGIRVQDVQAAYCGCVFQSMMGQKIFQQIGQTGIPIANVTNACATGATAVREAWMAIRTGDYDIVLAIGVEQMTGMGMLGGRIPVNVSGGLLSKGHPIGATGVANLYELTLHLRGEAGARQVEGARIGLAHVVGLGTCSAVHILEKA